MGSGTLLIFTESYPFSFAVEDSFIEPEIKACQREFSQIVLIPTQVLGQRATTSNHILVNEDFAHYLQTRRQNIASAFGLAIRSLVSSLLWREFLCQPTVVLRPSYVLKTLRHISGAFVAKDWAETYLRDHRPRIGNPTMLTYWLSSTTTGLALLKNKNQSLVVCSRAHGIDVYAERQTPPFFPCRDWTLRHIAAVFFTSTHARTYTNMHFPGHEKKLRIAPLGVPAPGWSCQPSSDDHFRIVSCSGIIPVKRIDLMAQGIAAFAAKFPDRTITWTHIGNGPLRQVVTDWCQDHMPPNVQWQFIGSLQNHQVMVFYRDHPIDIFLNMSASEGGRPVAIMEAMSCSIPAIGPSQGGIPEIINGTNGLLLPPDPKPEDIAQALGQALGDRPKMLAMRQAAYQTWKQSYNSEMNSTSFASALRQLTRSDNDPIPNP